MSEWISVKERLPENENEVVLATDVTYSYTARYVNDNWHCVCECFEGSSPYNITHWMPLPKPPEE